MPIMGIRSRPRNMMETNAKLMIFKIKREILSFPILGRPQPTLPDHEEWSYKQVSTTGQGKSRSSFTREIADADPH